MTTTPAHPETGFAPDAAPAHAWPGRAWGLALLGGLAGLALHLIAGTGPGGSAGPDALRLAAATFLGVSAIAFGFVVERGRLGSSLGFAAAAGLVVALTIYWAGVPGGGADDGATWRLLCAALAVGLAAPLFQAMRDRAPGQPLSYSAAHDRAWVNAVLWCAVWVFAGIVWLTAILLAALFELIDVSFPEKLLRKGWVALPLTGVALGAATGLLRDRESLLGLLQRAATAVLAVLAPVLALGLVLFLAALPFTGLEPLWQATRATTPILLLCIIGALILVNAVIGDAPAREARHPALRWSVPALCLALLPLGLVAAVSTCRRIQQHGLTPDRLWAAVFVAIALAYGLAYLWAVVRAAVRDRAGPARHLRPANLWLAFGLCGLALLLSTPLANFGALSARHQLARLERGAVTPEAFDWRALRFDFGPAGIKALERLAATGKTPAIRTAAADALKRTSRYDVPDRAPPVIAEERLTVLPAGAALPPALRARLGLPEACGPAGRCAVVLTGDGREAVIVTADWVSVWREADGVWRTEQPATRSPSDYAAEAQRRRQALDAGAVEIRTVTRRQVFVGGEPHGAAFE